MVRQAMREIPPARVVATRQLRERGTRRRVVVVVGTPARRSTGEYACPWQLRGVGDGQVRYTFGVDSMQALQLSFEAIRQALLPSRESLTWCDGETGGLGFTRTVNTAFGRTLSDRLDRMLEEEMERYARGTKARVAARQRRAARRPSYRR